MYEQAYLRSEPSLIACVICTKISQTNSNDGGATILSSAHNVHYVQMNKLVLAFFVCMIFTCSKIGFSCDKVYITCMQIYQLTPCPLGIFHAFCRLLIFFKINFFEKKFQECHPIENRLDPDQTRHFVRPDLGPICLQRLSADDTSRQN